MGILIAWLTASLGLWVSSKLLDRVELASFVDAIWAGALLGILQWALLGPIAVMLGIGTLGIGFLLWFLTRWIASALVIMLASALSSRLRVQGFVPALITALIVSVTGSVVRFFL
jgi:uncharacterized membrane protein YvlD (DUF360 family)